MVLRVIIAKGETLKNIKILIEDANMINKKGILSLEISFL